MTPDAARAVLGVDRSATEQEYRRASRHAAKRFHPDVAASAGSGPDFETVERAYRVHVRTCQRQAERSAPRPVSPRAGPAGVAPLRVLASLPEPVREIATFTQ